MDLMTSPSEITNEFNELAEPQVPTTSIQDLPNEILDYIFSFLDFVERAQIEVVSKRWHLVGSRPTQLVLSTEFLQYRKMDDDVVSSILIPRGPTLKELVLKVNPDLTCDSLTKLGQYCPNVVTLELHLVSNSQLSCLPALIPNCPNLKVVSVINYEGDADVYNDGLSAIAESCTFLKSLSISHLQRLSTNWIGALNPSLHVLSLIKTSISSEGIVCFMTRCEELQVFSLNNCQVLEGRTLCVFLKHFSCTLTVVRMIQQVSCFVHWHKALQRLINLEVLQLFRCENVDDDLMAVIALKCVKLRCLDIGATDVTNNGLTSLQKLKHLKELKMGRKTRVTSQGLESLVAVGILRRVTIPSEHSSLQEACRMMAAMYPNWRFAMEEEPEEIQMEVVWANEGSDNVLDSAWFV